MLIRTYYYVSVVTLSPVLIKSIILTSGVYHHGRYSDKDRQ